MTHKAEIPLVGGRFDGRRVIDPDIAMRQDDHIRIHDADGRLVEAYLIGYCNDAHAIDARSRLRGLSWSIHEGDLVQ